MLTLLGGRPCLENPCSGGLSRVVNEEMSEKCWLAGCLPAGNYFTTSEVVSEGFGHQKLQSGDLVG